LTACVACGYVRVTDFTTITVHQANEILQRDASDSPTSALSKKDQRKMKKHLKKMQKVAAVED